MCVTQVMEPNVWHLQFTDQFRELCPQERLRNKVSIDPRHHQVAVVVRLAQYESLFTLLQPVSPECDDNLLRKRYQSRPTFRLWWIECALSFLPGQCSVDK